jgi:hypothetical protein
MLARAVQFEVEKPVDESEAHDLPVEFGLLLVTWLLNFWTNAGKLPSDGIPLLILGLHLSTDFE